jgi:hypothetical protein
MSVPWTSEPKTWRDRLYDLAIAFNEIVTSDSDEPEAIVTRIDKTFQIEADINTWKSSWLSNEYPNLRTVCNCKSPTIFSCICSVPASKFPTHDFALLHVECWALQLLISTKLNKSVTTEPRFIASWVTDLSARTQQIASHMEAAATFTTIKNTPERSSGITESLCRTIFPAWTLREYQGQEASMNDYPSFHKGLQSQDSSKPDWKQQTILI